MIDSYFIGLPGVRPARFPHRRETESGCGQRDQRSFRAAMILFVGE